MVAVQCWRMKSLRIINTQLIMAHEINEKILVSLRTELNLQTAEYPWSELQRQFAAGGVIAVDPELDLVDVAARIAADDKQSVERWMETRQVAQVLDEQAQQWLEKNAMLWTVVVKPWILVQERRQPSRH